MVPIGSRSFPGPLRLLRHVRLGMPAAVVVVVVVGGGGGGVARTAAVVVMG